MQLFLSLIYLLTFIFFCFNIHTIVSKIAHSLSDYLIKYFLIFVATIIPTGFILSEMSWINQRFWWIFVALSITSAVQLIFIFRKYEDKFNLKNSLAEFIKTLPNWFKSLNFFQKTAFGILFFTLFITTIVNLAFLFLTVPNEWDSMTGHLVKCATYIQNGNMNRINGTTWTIDYYPNSLPTLQIFFYHLFGEKGFRVIHFLSYWVSILAIYGIAKQLYKNSTIAILIGLLMALLPTALVQATNTETDLVMTAYLGVIAYFIFQNFEKSPHQSGKISVGLLILTACISLGHKVTFILILPAVFILVLFTIFKEIWSHKLLIISILTIGVAIYVLPTGYIGNIKDEGKLGAISGPSEVMSWHGNTQFTGKQVAEFGTLNVGRYLMDFYNLDGIRNLPKGEKINDAMRFLPEKVGRKLNLERPEYTVVGKFDLDPDYPFHRERPFWGIISFLMFLPTIFLVFKSKKVENKKAFWGLFAATIIHFVCLSYTAPYDPIKARYFMNMAVWALPLIGLLFLENKRSIYLAFCSVFIALASLGTIFYRILLPICSTEKSIFSMNRMEQLTISRPEIYEAYKKFDEIVPKNAIVALGTQQEHEDFEYPLWGKGLTRKLIPIHPFRKPVKPIPAEAEYLFYSEGVIPYKEGDILLNKTADESVKVLSSSVFYLRKLK
jgi:hypothetical protein